MKENLSNLESKVTRINKIVSDDEDQVEETAPLKSKTNEKEQVNDAEKRNKKRKKSEKTVSRVKFVDDSSNDSRQSKDAKNEIRLEKDEPQTKPQTKPQTLNYDDFYKKLFNENSQGLEDSDSDDDEMPLSAQITKMKKQRLVLSEGDDE